MLPSSLYFPPAESAAPDGLVGVGGQLTSDWIVDAYRHGIFPWPSSPRVLGWWSPDPRGIFELDQFHISRRLARRLRSGEFTVTFDRDFAGVIEGCASAAGRVRNTWITPELKRAYIRLHAEGIAHSVETWQEEQLVGGVYGIAIGGLFAGESMFYRATDASKVALAQLVEHLRERRYTLFDIQMVTAHTRTLGAQHITRREYLSRLESALELPVTFAPGATQP